MAVHGFVEMEHVTVVRGGSTVLSDLSLSIGTGEQVALLGPNGCGKSTLLKTLAYELYPLPQPQTSIRVLGRERWDLTELKKQLGVVQNEIPGRPMLAISGYEAVLTGFFSSSTLWPHLKVTEGMRERAVAILERIDGLSLRDKCFGEMSAGQQRRILIGRALVASAGCLLLDEPSNALDLSAQRGLRELLMSLAADGTTMLHITHHVADIIPTMQRVIFMKAGKIVADGGRANLLTEGRLGELFDTRVSLAERDGFLHAW